MDIFSFSFNVFVIMISFRQFILLLIRRCQMASERYLQNKTVRIWVLCKLFSNTAEKLFKSTFIEIDTIEHTFMQFYTSKGPLKI